MTDDFAIDTAAPGAPPGSPLAYARLLAGVELREQCTPSEVAWLHAHPLLWLRALAQAIYDAQTRTGKDRLGLKSLRAAELSAAAARGERNPQPGEDYQREAAELRRRQVSREHFLQRATARRAEVEALCGDDVRSPLLGEIAGALADIARMADTGEPLGDIRRKALHWAARIEAAHGGTALVPDKSAAAPIRITAAGMQPDTRLRCRVCYDGLIDPHAPAPNRCPRCFQQHQIHIPKCGTD